MKAFVINIEQQVGRMAHMASVLSALDIAFERFDAIAGPRIDEHPLAAIVGRGGYRPLGRGEIGCLLSHIEVWRLIAEGDDDFAAVFEDDVFLDPRVALFLGAPQVFPAGTDIVKLDTHGKPTYLSNRAYKGPADLEFRRLRSRHYGCAAYVISHEAAARLAAQPAKFNVPVDAAVFEPQHRIGRDLRVFQVVPALAIQAMLTVEGRNRPEFRSQIDSDRAVALAAPKARARRRLRDVPKSALGSLRGWAVRLNASQMVVPFEAALAAGSQTEPSGS